LDRNIYGLPEPKFQLSNYLASPEDSCKIFFYKDVRASLLKRAGKFYGFLKCRRYDRSDWDDFGQLQGELGSNGKRHRLTLSCAERETKDYVDGERGLLVEVCNIREGN
jgi:hypothetical protein